MPVRLQELCDLVQAGTVRVFFETWMSRLPLPLTDADRDHAMVAAGHAAVEVSRTLVFDDPRRVRTVFEELLAGDIDRAGPSMWRSSRLQGPRGEPGTFSTRLLNRGTRSGEPVLKHSRVKIYLKEDRALRVETVINDPGDLLQAQPGAPGRTGAKAARRPLMERVPPGSASSRIQSSSGSRTPPSTQRAEVPAMRFATPVQALAGPHLGARRLRHHQQLRA